MMADSGETKILAIITICIILISIGLSGCVEDGEKDKTEYIYNLQFIPEGNEIEYHIIIPFPIHRDKQDDPNHEIIEKLNKLNINYEIESTFYGNGINISYQSKIDILIKETTETTKEYDMYFYEFSLLNGSILFDESNYWVFSSINGTIDYKYDISGESLEHYYRITGNIKRGWQSIKAKVWKHDVD